jgi:hypothetical protein
VKVTAKSPGHNASWQKPAGKFLLPAQRDFDGIACLAPLKDTQLEVSKGIGISFGHMGCLLAHCHCVKFTTSSAKMKKLYSL